MSTILQFTYIAGRDDVQVKTDRMDEGEKTCIITPVHTSTEENGSQVQILTDEETFTSSSNTSAASPATQTEIINDLDSTETPGINNRCRPSTSTQSTSTTFGEPDKVPIIYIINNGISIHSFKFWCEKFRTWCMTSGWRNLKLPAGILERRLRCTRRNWIGKCVNLLMNHLALIYLSIGFYLLCYRYSAKAEEEHWEVAKILGEENVNGQTLLKIKWKPSYITMDEARKFAPKLLGKFMAKKEKCN